MIVDVTLLPMGNRNPEEHRTILVGGERVLEVGAAGSVRIPEGALVVDGAGRYLMPGLVDSHVHLRDTTELAAYLAHGVTSVFQLSGPQGAVEDLTALKRDVESGRRPGPQIFLSGRLIDGDPPIFPRAADVVTTPDEGRRLTLDRRDRGYDFVKVYNNVPRDALTAIISTAHDNDMLVFGHIPRAEGRDGALEHALASGIDVVAHGEEFFFTYFYRGIDDQVSQGLEPEVDTAGFGEVIQRVSDAGAFVTPNLSFVRQTRLWLEDPPAIYGDDEFLHLPPYRRLDWERNQPGNRDNLSQFDARERAKSRFLDLLTIRLHEAGVPLLSGTDASFAGLYPGASLHLELRELVRVGLTPLEALSTATSAPGRLVGAMAFNRPPFGIIEEGARADLVLLEDDPSEDLDALDSILGVVVAGRWLDRERLDQMRPVWPRF